MRQDAEVRSKRAVFGVSEGGNLSMLFAATCPDRAPPSLPSVVRQTGMGADYVGAPPEPRGD